MKRSFTLFQPSRWGRVLAGSFLIGASLASSLVVADNLATLRGEAGLANVDTAPATAKMANDDVKRQRNYPMQPPLIPHNIRDYQVDLKTNKCLSCHSRQRTEESQAPMISVTHYMNRDGNFLADVSPRRYFCNQCHVPQAKLKPLVDNEFVDMDRLINKP